MSSPVRPWIIKSGDITHDTTHEGSFQPIVITARLAEPVVSVADPIHLDGPLAWATYIAAKESSIVIPALRNDRPPLDFALPLATWTAADPGGAHESTLTPDGRVWGWACSRAQWAPVGWTAAHTRKAPPLKEYVRYTTDRKYHAALGPHKARNATHQAVLADRIIWHALGEPEQLIEALLRLRALGRLTRHGWGRIHQITVAPGHDRDAWADRSWPDPAGQPGTIRAPYWHRMRGMRCSSTRPA